MFYLILHTTDDYLNCLCLWLEECLESFFRFVEFEPMRDQLLRVNHTTA